MTAKSNRPENLQKLLRAVHREREALPVDHRWVQHTLVRIRHLAAPMRSPVSEYFGEKLFWGWFAAGGIAAAVMAWLLVNFQLIPDADIWSFLVYENETLNMLQTYWY